MVATILNSKHSAAMRFTKGQSLFASITIISLTVLCGCGTFGAVKSTRVELSPARTNVETVLATNWVNVPVAVTNLVTVTNAVGVLQTNVVTQTNLVFTPLLVTNVVTLVTPAVSYQSNSLAPVVGTVVSTAGNVAGVAGVPFASTIASGLLGLSTLVLGYMNRRNAQKALAEAEGHAETRSALETAKTIGLTLLENVETIRTIAKTVPGYTKDVDSKAMSAIQTAQRIAGVKNEIHSLVEAHTT